VGRAEEGIGKASTKSQVLAELGHPQIQNRPLISTKYRTIRKRLLPSWVSFIEHKALVVLPRVPNDANAYKMFETLNDRGLRTSHADVIRNYLFGRSGDRINEVQTRWAYMRGALESLEEDNITIDFLRHALIAIRGPVREAQVYDFVQELVKEEQAAITFTSTLEFLATSYVATFNSEHDKWNGYPDAVRPQVD
jgi:hypothetical protein